MFCSDWQRIIIIKFGTKHATKQAERRDKYGYTGHNIDVPAFQGEFHGEIKQCRQKQNIHRKADVLRFVEVVWEPPTFIGIVCTQ